jgi:hypothetical protein
MALIKDHHHANCGVTTDRFPILLFIKNTEFSYEDICLFNHCPNNYYRPPKRIAVNRCKINVIF